MAKAIQVEFLMAGVIDSTNGLPLAGGKVNTFVAGTSNPKTTFTAPDKLTNLPNPIVLDSQGRANVFADGKYKFVIDDANDVTQQTIDNLDFSVADETVINRDVTTISSTSTLAAGDDFIIADDTASSFTLNLPTAAGITGKRYQIKRISSGSNTTTVDGFGAETIDGNATIVIAQQNEVVEIISDGTNWRRLNDVIANAAKLDNLDSTQFLRADINTAFTGSFINMNNDSELRGKDIGGTGRNLVKVNTGDSVVLGDAALPVGITTNNSTTGLTHNGFKIFHAGNDGAGSGLDADDLDGQSGAFIKGRANHTGIQAPSTISPQGSGSGLNADVWHGQNPLVLAALVTPGVTNATTTYNDITGATVTVVDGEIASSGTNVLCRATIEYKTNVANKKIGFRFNVADVEKQEWLDTSTGLLNGETTFSIIHSEELVTGANRIIKLRFNSNDGSTTITIIKARLEVFILPTT